MLLHTGGGLGWMISAVNDTLNWRWTFHILGIAGLALVPVASLAMWEPASVHNSRKKRQSGKPSYSIKVRERGKGCTKKGEKNRRGEGGHYM